MYYPNSRYDYYLDCTEENERKRNILWLADRFLNFHNPDRCDRIGEKPKTVDTQTYQRAKVQFSEDKKDWCYIDMWIVKGNNESAVIIDNGGIQKHTTKINSVQSIAEMISEVLGYHYNYNDIRLNIWGYIP